MNDSRYCETCNALFFRPPRYGQAKWESRKYCSRACQQFQPPSFVPCRICGEPTKYRGHAGSKNAALLRCERSECIEESQHQKNQAIGRTAIRKYATGERAKVRHAWQNVKRISPEEVVLTPWFKALGWEPQFKFLTDVHTVHLPRVFYLDFALPASRLYIEIDGHVHRLRKDKDARRDAMMQERGWIGLRVPARLVRDDTKQAKQLIRSWIKSHRVVS